MVQVEPLPIFDERLSRDVLEDLNEFLVELSRKHQVDIRIKSGKRTSAEMTVKLIAQERPEGVGFYAWHYHHHAEIYGMSRAWMSIDHNDQKGRKIKIIGFDPKRDRRPIIVLIEETGLVEYWTIEETSSTYNL